MIWFQWPRIVKPKSEISEATSLLDIYPTVRDIVSDKSDEEDVNALDGESLLRLLRGEKKRSERSLYHFCDSEIFAMRTQLEDGIYKLIIREPLLNARGSCDGIYFSKLNIIFWMSLRKLHDSSWLATQLPECTQTFQEDVPVTGLGSESTRSLFFTRLKMTRLRVTL